MSQNKYTHYVCMLYVCIYLCNMKKKKNLSFVDVFKYYGLSSGSLLIFFILTLEHLKNLTKWQPYSQVILEVK